MVDLIKNIFRRSPSSSDEKYFHFVERLIVEGAVERGSSVARALQAVKRSQFLTEGTRDRAFVDAPIAIPGGQTNSQPTTVAIMLRELAVRAGDRVLDVGFGSGWTTALLAVMVGGKGRVWGIETHPDVFAFGEENIAHFSQKNDVLHIKVSPGDGKKGWIEASPFDRILVSAAADKVPEALLAQLAPAGRMVIPVRVGDGESLRVIEKDAEHGVRSRDIPGFRFVPLV